MCLAVPFKLTSIDGDDAIAENNGVYRTVKINFIREPKIGDYVIVHAGYAIEKLKEREAMETAEAFRELESALNGTDS